MSGKVTNLYIIYNAADNFFKNFVADLLYFTDPNNYFFVGTDDSGFHLSQH